MLAAPQRCVVRTPPHADDADDAATSITAATTGGSADAAASAATIVGTEQQSAPAPEPLPCINRVPPFFKTMALSLIKAAGGLQLQFSSAREGQLVVRGSGIEDAEDHLGVVTAVGDGVPGMPEVTIRWCRTGRLTKVDLQSGRVYRVRVAVMDVAVDDVAAGPP
ncbi:hypothetical protein HXX76_002965 [Chlamydomonas incerta]|uniref:Uncharacterized protein n=1 Tax=Chlamydomonas incerta TaxID=51695 RepID=A0A835W700_CHLIN|nr:hypothetical protein HXX76_002965 [Chlamydomonas incerta]|eukprot:KAG2442887.1 hypothetical protein HXX76_002965 [Chlamydomonas incerta]